MIGTPLLIATHTLVFAAGVLSGVYGVRFLAAREGNTGPREGSGMSSAEQERRHRRRRRLSVILVVLVVSFVMLAGFGIQQAFFQAQSNRRDRCVTAWGSEFVAAVTSRSNATQVTDDAARLRDAKRVQRDRALDQIVEVVVAARAHGAPSTPELEARFDRALASFIIAKNQLTVAQQALDRAQSAQKHARAQNPYPRLDCH